MKLIKDYLFITIGLLIVALSIHLFMVPNNFVAGGISGLAIVINYLSPNLPVGLIMLISEVFLFTLGIFTIGKHFGARTIFSSFTLSGLIWLLEIVYPINEPLMSELFIQLLVGMVMSAIGMAIVFKHNASTGGTDITAKILNKYFHIDLGKGVLLCDLAVTLSAFLVFPFEIVVYGLAGIMMNGLIIDIILNKFKEKKEITIITDDNARVKDFIMHSLEKGATIYIAKGAYTNNQKEAITTVLNKGEYIRLKKYMIEHDINAFITVNDLSETFGLGFETLIP
jgi:uncharacterized membrane-anchored protein YitT (DUF2179 family)